jgi:Kef-type K+ transport system membrane component KefB
MLRILAAVILVIFSAVCAVYGVWQLSELVADDQDNATSTIVIVGGIALMLAWATGYAGVRMARH